MKGFFEQRGKKYYTGYNKINRIDLALTRKTEWIKEMDRKSRPVSLVGLSKFSESPDTHFVLFRTWLWLTVDGMRVDIMYVMLMIFFLIRNRRTSTEIRYQILQRT